MTQSTEDYTSIIFAGSAPPVSEGNLLALLNQNIDPDKLYLFNILADTRHSPGLRIIADWILDEYPKNPAFPASDIAEFIPQHIDEGNDPAKVELWVLWGGNDDRAAEEAVDAAMKAGVTVRDLNNGLDELELSGSNPAEQKPPSSRRQGRRGKPREPEVTKPEPAAADEKPPWEEELPAPVTAGLAGIDVAALMTDIAEAVIPVLQRHFRGEQPVPVPAAVMADDEPGQAPDGEKPARERSRRDRNPPGVHAYYQDPGDKRHIVVRDRGRLPSGHPMYDWPVVKLHDDTVKAENYRVTSRDDHEQ